MAKVSLEDVLQQFRDDARNNRDLGDRFDALATGGGAVPLADGSVDVLTSFTVLEHVHDERETLAEFRRLLNPGGRLVLTVPNKWWIFETHGADLPLLPWNRVPLVKDPECFPQALSTPFQQAQCDSVAQSRAMRR